MECAWITDGRSKRRACDYRFIKRRRKLWIRIFRTSRHQEAAETRMGKGKGAPEKWVAVVKPGRIMFEMASGRSDGQGSHGLAAHKLPIPTSCLRAQVTMRAY